MDPADARRTLAGEHSFRNFAEHDRYSDELSDTVLVLAAMQIIDVIEFLGIYDDLSNATDLFHVFLVPTPAVLPQSGTESLSVIGTYHTQPDDRRADSAGVG
jgi:hypothetical protein